MHGKKIDNQSIKRQLYDLAEPKFQKFSSALIPNIPAESMVGVRLPKLRKIAKEIAKGDWRSYLTEAEDESFEETAIRETMEELLIESENIEILGELDYLVSYSNFTIHCFLGLIKGLNIEDINPSDDEVDHIFTVPIDYLIDNEPKKYELDLMTVVNEEFPYSLLPNGKDYNWRRGKHLVLFYKYMDYIIWGFTARMTKHLIDLIKSI